MIVEGKVPYTPIHNNKPSGKVCARHTKLCQKVYSSYEPRPRVSGSFHHKRQLVCFRSNLQAGFGDLFLLFFQLDLAIMIQNHMDIVTILEFAAQ